MNPTPCLVSGGRGHGWRNNFGLSPCLWFTSCKLDTQSFCLASRVCRCCISKHGKFIHRKFARSHFHIIMIPQTIWNDYIPIKPDLPIDPNSPRVPALPVRQKCQERWMFQSRRPAAVGRFCRVSTRFLPHVV